MTEPRPDDAMLEIGDIDEESTAPAGPEGPRVVIEYRDRGVPWMLVPPLLAMAGVVAGVGAYAWVERQRDRRPDPAPTTVAAITPAAEAPPAGPAAPPIDPPLPPGSVAPTPVAALDPKPDLPPISLPPPAPVDLAPAVVTPAVAAVEDVGGDPAPPEMPTPPPAPRVEALGFDPTAIREPGDAPAAPVDRNVAATQGDPVPPTKPAAEADATANGPDEARPAAPLPLPPDPRVARAERAEHDRALRRKAAQDRVRFHADLQAICKQFGQRAAPAIAQLCDRYGRDVPAAAKERAAKELGAKGSFVGASLATRIALLRRLGFPESLILTDLYEIQTSQEGTNGRNMPSAAVVYVHAAQILLSHPPTRATPAARGAAPPQANSRPGAAPAAAPPGG